MKTILRVCDMKSSSDIAAVKNAIAQTEGIMACEINPEKKEVCVYYDNTLISEDGIIQSLENAGYVVF